MALSKEELAEKREMQRRAMRAEMRAGRASNASSSQDSITVQHTNPIGQAQGGPQLQVPKTHVKLAAHEHHKHRAHSPLEQYTLFPLPPVRSPRSSSSPAPVSPHFSSSSPPTFPLPPLPNRDAAPSSPPLTISRKGSGYFSFEEEEDNHKYGLGISHVIDEYSYRHPSIRTAPPTMALPPTPEDSDDTYSVVSTSDSSIDAESVNEEEEGGGEPFEYDERSTSLASAIELRRRSNTSSLASSASTTSLAGFEELVSIARNGEAEARQREAETIAALQAEEEDLGGESDDDFGSSCDGEWEQCMAGTGTEDKDLRRQGSTLSFGELHRQLIKPEMRSRQSTVRPSWTLQPRRQIVFDECSSSDEEAFDLSLDTTHVLSPESPSASSSFSFRRRESTHTEVSQTSTAATSVDEGKSPSGDPLPLPLPVAFTLRPLHLPTRIQQRKASVPAISWAESPVKPERDVKTAVSTPNLRSRLPLFGKKNSLARLASYSSATSTSMSTSSPSISTVSFPLATSSQRSSTSSVATITSLQQQQKPLPQLPPPPISPKKLRTFRSSPALRVGVLGPNGTQDRRGSLGLPEVRNLATTRRSSLIPSRFSSSRLPSRTAS